MNTRFRTPSILFRSIDRLMQNVLPQLSFSFCSHQLIHADFSGGQILRPVCMRQIHQPHEGLRPTGE